MSPGTLYFWIIGLPVAIVVVVILLAAHSQHRRNELLATTGQGAAGRVLELGHDDDDLGGISRYWVKVQYDYDGEAVTAKVPVNHRDQHRYQAGQRVGLTYAPSRPKLVRLDPPEWPLPPTSRPGRHTTGR